MKKIISILIVMMMIMQMFTFAVSSEEATYSVRWTGEGPGEIAFVTMEGMSNYEIRLYKNEGLVAETSHSVVGLNHREECRAWFLTEITDNGSGTYRAEVIYEDGVTATTGNYTYKAPRNSLPKVENVDFNQEKGYITWKAIEDACLYEVVFCFSIDYGQTFMPTYSYILLEEDGTFFDFWGNSAEELAIIEECFRQEMENNGATEEEFVRAVQIGAYPVEFNNLKPSKSDYITFDGIMIPDDGYDEPVEPDVDVHEQFRELCLNGYSYDYYPGDEFEADLSFVIVYEDGTETYVKVNLDDCVIHGFDSYTPGLQTVEIWCGNYSVMCDVMVHENVVPDDTYYGVRFENVKTEYNYGEEFYIEVYEVNAEGEEVRINDYVVSGFEPYTSGWQTVVVSYGDYSEMFKVYVSEKAPEVNPVELIGIEIVPPYKTEYITGEDMNFDGLEVYALYSDGSRVAIKNYWVSGFDSSSEGENTITVGYDGYTAQFDVIINKATDGSIASGTCGDNLRWALYEDGLFKVTGEGDMLDYEYINYTPWYNYRDQIKIVKIEQGVTSVGEAAFGHCYNLKTVTLPYGITKIAKGAFASCTELEDVNVPESVSEIGDNAFSSCRKLININIPYGVQRIGKSAFYDCETLTSIELPDSITEIGGFAFSDCIGLTSVNISNSVVKIGEYAFDECENLTSITLGNGITHIERYAFDTTDNLKNVYYNGTESDWEKVTVENYNDDLLNATFYFKEATEPEEPEEPEESTYWQYNEEEKELIIFVDGDMEGYDCNLNQNETYTTAPWEHLRSEIEIITIEDSVTSISKGVFAYYPNLKEVNLGENIRRISSNAFEGCKQLKEIVIPDSVTIIESRAFVNCGLETIEFGNGIHQLTPLCFSGCNFESVTLPENLIAIGTSSFSNCRNMKEVYIPSSVRSINPSAFANCVALEDVYYEGTSEQWGNITIEIINNECLLNATLHCKGDEPEPIFIYFENVKSAYNIGEEFYVEVWVETSEETYMIESGYIVEGFDNTMSGWQTVTVSYEGYSETFDVYVNEEIDEPDVPDVPDDDVLIEFVQTNYRYGETFNARVCVLAADGSYYPVEDYKVIGFDSYTPGVQEVTIVYGNYSETFEVRVSEKLSPGGSGGGGGEIIPDGPVISISEAKCRAGNTVDVVVSISNNDGFANLGLEINYERSLTLVDVKVNSGVGATFTSAQNFDVYPYNFSFDSTSDVMYNGELVTLTFNVPEDTQPGDYYVDVDFYKGRNGDYVDGVSVNYNEADEALGLCYENGIINVYDYIPGDINGDGMVTNKDGTSLLRYLAGWENISIDENALDTDGDGMITNKDGTILLRYLAGWDVEVY